jgi:hypothetical protein
MNTTTAIKDIVTAACSITAVYIGWLGLSNWKRQLILTEIRRVAKQVVLDTLQLEQQLRVIRELSFLYRMPESSDMQIPNSSQTSESGRSLESSYREVLKELLEKETTLKSSALEAKVLFGKEAYELVTKFLNVLDKFTITLNMHFRNQQSNVNYTIPSETMSIMYRNESCHFDQEIHEASDGIIDYYSKFLHPKEKN